LAQRAYEHIVTDNKGNKSTECGRWENYDVSCTKRSGSFKFIPKLIQVETGKIVYSNTINESENSSECSDSGRSLTGNSELLGILSNRTADEFRRNVAPYYITVEIELMDSKDGMTIDTAKEKLKQAMDFAKNGRIDRACELWGEARIIEPNSLSLIYDLGICAELTGDLEQAADLFKKADKMLIKPDQLVSDALTRTTKSLADKKKLQEL